MDIAEMRWARVLTKAFSIASHFRPVLNTRLLALIRSKLWRMGKALSRNSAGQWRQICERWQKSDWVFVL